MGLNDVDLTDDGDGGGGGGGDVGGGEDKASAVSCSICLEAVTDNGDRSWSKLQCGHQFHLDCIGSAFNIKGQMQCPNCRKIEKGQWLYASGCRPLPDFNMEDWAHDEDLYDLSYTEMSFGVHWCPFSGLTRLPSSYDEGELSSSAYHDLLGQHAIFADHTAVSSAAHPCPYIAYVGIHPSSSNSSGSINDGPNFNNHWTSPSVPNEMPASYAFPGMDVHYHSWDHHSSFPMANSRVGTADQSSVPSVTQRVARTNADIPRPGSFVPPFLVGHGSAARAGSSVASPMIPPYPGSVARARDRVQALQAYFQQPSNSPAVRTPVMSATRRSNNHRGLAQMGPAASSSDQAGGFYFYPSSSSGRNFQEAENPVSNRYHAWEREHLPAFPLSQVDRDPIWGPFHHTGVGSDSGSRSGSFRPRHGPERMPSQNRS
ncbi:E3 ubiquitin-protein ligase RFI2 [Solanum stenotomum]|uniref:E3 ubiquitin-protein ligase RFI2 n=1 Tax=Solanum stenotomum TaxID=172797 RepID=UPI0020D009BA|nr:E3 ubiquitin-protein ligase RFI2 [Solanum stenotomum]